MTKEDFLNIVINLNDLTTSNLLKKGISSYYISKFVREKIIFRIKKGEYELNFDMVYSYGKKLLKSNLVGNANLCFLKCLEIRNDFIPLYYQLLIVNIRLRKFLNVLEILDLLSNLNFLDENERKYQLFLLSNIIELPAKYFEELRFLSFDDIRYIKKEDPNMYNENKLRGLCFQKAFAEAEFKSRKVVERKYCSVFNVIHNLLISDSKKQVDEKFNTMREYIIAGKYHDAKFLLDKEINPPKYNIYLYKLLNEIIFLEENGVPSKTTLLNASNVFEAIDGKNFSLALILSKNDNLLNDLLKIICNMIKEITNPIIEKKENFSLNYFTEINRDNFNAVENEINFICKFLEKKRGIYIMECFNEKTTNDLLNIFTLYPNLKAFLINYNMEDRIVVKYTPKFMSEIDEKNNFLYASYLYEYEYYNECLDICLGLLKQEEPTMDVYLLAGYSYMKLKKIKEARECFMVVYHFTKNSKYDEIISKINGVYAKPMFEMNINEFVDNEINVLEKK